MANGPKGFEGVLSEKELEVAKRLASKGGARNGRLKKLLGMTKRPTTAGQALFGDVDVLGDAQRRIRQAGRGFQGSLSEKELELARSLQGPSEAKRLAFKGPLSEKELKLAKRAAGY